MDYAGQFQFALLLALPIACVAWTVTQEEVFKEVRDALKAYQRRHAGSLWRRKLAYMPTCPYCFSHYLAALFIAVFRFKMLVDDWRGYLVSLFALVLIANVYVSLYSLLRVALRGAKGAADRAEVGARDVRRLTAAAEPSETRRPAGRAVIPIHGSNGRWKPPVRLHDLNPAAARKRTPREPSRRGDP
jgi:hypothetical protein